MLELGISQAQTKFTQLLNQTVLIVDKKAHHKKAVILPYEKYIDLISKTSQKDETLKDSVFSQFVGVLDNDFQTDDTKYKTIVS